MKAYLKFDLPEEREEFELASKAGDLLSALCSIDRILRGRLKHEEPSDEERATLDAIRKLIPYDLV